MNLWERSYLPVKIEARLAAQMEVDTNMLRKSVPCLASLSMFGVFKIGCPALGRVDGSYPLEELWGWAAEAAVQSGYLSARSRATAGSW